MLNSDKGRRCHILETQKEAEVTSVLMHEERIFYPSADIVEAAIVKDWEAELKAGEDIEKVLGRQS